jgi:N-sulfoglucosamine sulfohydrolase
MKISPMLERILFTSVLSLVAAASALAAPAPEPPNIVFILADDVSSDFGCYGGDAQTPNIDRLAAKGVRFDNFYVTASSCSPSRCSIITGRYPHNTGAPELHMELPEGQFLFPGALKEAGYYSVQAGKWHMGEYAKQAFDEVYETEEAPDPGWSDRFVPCLKERPRGRPFFMWFASFDAHRPWEEDPEVPAVDPALLSLPAGVPDTPKARADLASYLVEVQRFDRYVGKVVEELKAQGVFENTLLVVTSDNGRPFPRNKTTVYDNGVKVPLIVHWPEGKLAEGAVSRSLVSAIDLAPTFLAAAGLPVPPEVQGVDFLSVCRNPDTVVRNYIFAERNWHTQRACQRMVRHGDYVYIRDFAPDSYSFQRVEHEVGAYAELLRLRAGDSLTPEQAEEFSTDMPREMLFDVAKDPQQLVNLAPLPEYESVRLALRGVLDEWQSRTGDSIPAVEAMTPDRHDPETFARLYGASVLRPPDGVMPGEEAGATRINDPGPR